MTKSESRKQYLKLLGIDFLYIVTVTAVALLSLLIIYFKRTYVRSHGGFFSGDVYKFNYICFALGTVLFFTLFLLINYKLIRNRLPLLTNYHFLLQIVFWLIHSFISIVAIFPIIIVIFLFDGLGDYTEPQFLETLCIYWNSVILSLSMGIQIIIENIHARTPKG